MHGRELFRQALEPPHLPTCNGPNSNGQKILALEVMEDAPRTKEVDAAAGARTSPEHTSRNAHVGLTLPTKLKSRSQQSQHVHGNGLPDPFSTASVCGNLIAAVPEHPEELSPQSALQKKTPLCLNGSCHAETDGSSSASGPSKQLHLALPHSAAPSTHFSSDEVTEGLRLGGLESWHFQTEVKEKELNGPQQANNNDCLGKEIAQHVEGVPEKLRPILSQEELLEGAQKNVDVAGNVRAGYESRMQDMLKPKDDGQSTAPSSDMRILRSKTVMIPDQSISRIPRDTPLRRQTTAVQCNQHKNTSPSVDSSRGTPS